MALSAVSTLTTVRPAGTWPRAVRPAIYGEGMPQPSATQLAVAEAVEHHRHRLRLTIDQLADRLHALGHPLGPDGVRDIERAAVPADVDDLMALAVALEVSPTTLLTHVPDDHPGEAPIATGVPADVQQPELIDWMTGRTKLDLESRIAWAQEQIERLEVRSVHHADQARGARQELDDLGELALQEADSPHVQRLRERVQESEHAMVQADVALAYARHRLSRLQAVQRR